MNYQRTSRMCWRNRTLSIEPASVSCQICHLPRGKTNTRIYLMIGVKLFIPFRGIWQVKLHWGHITEEKWWILLRILKSFTESLPSYFQILQNYQVSTESKKTNMISTLKSINLREMTIFKSADVNAALILKENCYGKQINLSPISRKEYWM